MGEGGDFPLFLFIGGMLVAGMCWISQEGRKLYPTEGNPYGMFDELLYCCSIMLNAPYTQFTNKNIKAYETNLSINWSKFVFRSEGNILKIHYNNLLLKETNCPEFKGKHRGVVELPLKEFVEDVLKISREYLEKYAPVIEKIRLEHGEEPNNYDSLWELYREVEELYKKKFGSENR
nr:hypothetical protein [Thermococcus sp. 9N3]